MFHTIWKSYSKLIIGLTKGIQYKPYRRTWIKVARSSTATKEAATEDAERSRCFRGTTSGSDSAPESFGAGRRTTRGTGIRPARPAKHEVRHNSNHILTSMECRSGGITVNHAFRSTGIIWPTGQGGIGRRISAQGNTKSPGTRPA